MVEVAKCLAFVAVVLEPPPSYTAYHCPGFVDTGPGWYQPSGVFLELSSLHQPIQYLHPLFLVGSKLLVRALRFLFCLPKFLSIKLALNPLFA